MPRWPIFKWDHFSCWSIKVIKQGSWGHVQMHLIFWNLQDCSSSKLFLQKTICSPATCEEIIISIWSIMLVTFIVMVVTCLADLSNWQQARSLCGKRFNLFHLSLSLCTFKLVADLSNWHLRPCNQCGKGLHFCLPSMCNAKHCAFCSWKTQWRKAQQMQPVWKGVATCAAACQPCALQLKRHSGEKLNKCNQCGKRLPTTCSSVTIALFKVLTALCVKCPRW